MSIRTVKDVGRGSARKVKARYDSFLLGPDSRASDVPPIPRDDDDDDSEASLESDSDIDKMKVYELRFRRCVVGSALVGTDMSNPLSHRSFDLDSADKDAVLDPMKYKD